jgi:hypothetical protein
MRARKWHNEESADLELVNLQSGSTDLSASYRVSTAKHTYLWRGEIVLFVINAMKLVNHN